MFIKSSAEGVAMVGEYGQLLGSWVTHMSISVWRTSRGTSSAFDRPIGEQVSRSVRVSAGREVV
jgi:hypothetical protein